MDARLASTPQSSIHEESEILRVVREKLLIEREVLSNSHSLRDEETTCVCTLLGGNDATYLQPILDYALIIGVGPRTGTL